MKSLKVPTKSTKSTPKQGFPWFPKVSLRSLTLRSRSTCRGRCSAGNSVRCQGTGGASSRHVDGAAHWGKASGGFRRLRAFENAVAFGNK